MNPTYVQPEASPDALPPSYEVAIRTPAHAHDAPSRSTSSQNAAYRQFDGFSEEEQREREQELTSYEYSGRRSGPSSASTSAPSSSRSAAVCVSSSLSTTVDPKSALARYGSPFATSSDWSPSLEDARMTQLPQLDLELRLKMRFTGPSSEQRAVAPPPSWSRRFTPAYTSASIQFEPIYIPSANNKEADKQLLADGFQSLYPGRLMVHRDVSAADWGRFLEDIIVAGRLTGKQSSISNVAPITMHIGITGFLVTRAIEKGMKKRKNPLIYETVEAWQQNFFQSRNLDVYVIHNGQRRTARSPNGPIPASTSPALSYPALPYPAMSNEFRRSHTSSSSSSSSSLSSDSSNDGKQSKPLRKQMKAERKHERKMAKIERKHQRKIAKIERKHKRQQIKYPGMPDLQPGPYRAAVQSVIPSPATSSCAVLRQGYYLVTAPLPATSW